MDILTEKCLKHFTASSRNAFKEELCRARDSDIFRRLRHVALLQCLYMTHVLSAYLDFYDLLKSDVEESNAIDIYIYPVDHQWSWCSNLRLQYANNWSCMTVKVWKDGTITIVLQRVEEEELKMQGHSFKIDDAGTWAGPFHFFLRQQWENARFVFYPGEERESLYREMIAQKDMLIDYLFSTFIEGVIVHDSDDE